jgi:hypothetical protein
MTSLGFISADFISGSQVSLSLPVSFRRRFVRRYRILGELVSGRKKKRKMRQNDDSHSSSQIVHFQPFRTPEPPD